MTDELCWYAASDDVHALRLDTDERAVTIAKSAWRLTASASLVVSGGTFALYDHLGALRTAITPIASSPRDTYLYNADDAGQFLVGGDANPLLVRLDPEHGRRLAALPCDLVWATTWMAKANEVLAPRLGLPQLPVVDWLDDEGDSGRPHWKTRSHVQWAAGRRFVWADDENRRRPDVGGG